ncbi:LOW QUALITY PROTEIN: bcl-2-like protein 13 [Denticeps clupeoides]|uniref:LOW QUALITY PROTEIN: bcl-2-like protein 13 n=1 Tax=Denticeps clupeoides TaxID=299321 RepID=UPI0010A2B362|nr:LOW QUALITY PROTEIN: bcl-2-like protein 13 [Denticeps clupeoides]
MAAFGPASMAVPEGFCYETKYVVLSYLGLLPTSRRRAALGSSAEGVESVAEERARLSRMKSEVEDELRRLQEDIAASFSTTGFDTQLSPVFAPADPERSVEDSLAAVGDRVTQDLQPHLDSVLQTLLGSSLDYEGFRSAVLELGSHTQSGWNQVLVPLLLLQELFVGGGALGSLLSMGVRFLEETQTEFILKQGGWGSVFSLDEAEDAGVIIAEDSNDIYILSGDQAPDGLSPPRSLLPTTAAHGGEPGSWRTESFPASGHESWAHVSAMDPEDAKSLDSNEGAALAEERSENNSSNSDIVHVEREEAEQLAEGEELQESMLSVLGSESELAALREELKDEGDAIGKSPTPPFIPEEPLLELEEPVVIVETPASLLEASPTPIEVESAIMSEVPVKLDLVNTSTLSELQTESPAVVPVVEEPAPPPPPVQTKEEPKPEADPESAQAPAAGSEVTPPADPPVHSGPLEPKLEPESNAEPEPAGLPAFLYGGAALVAIAAVTCAILAYRKK